MDIFKETNENVVPKWAKFKEPGDSVQGTYIMKIENQLSPGYNQEQTIYQLLQDDGTVINAAFGTNKKVLHKEMENVKFGQIIGFKFKGTSVVSNRRSPGTTIKVKDYAVHQDPKIINEAWLKEHEGENITSIKADNSPSTPQRDVENLATDLKVDTEKDVPFSSEGSLTNEDKLAVIEKLAKDKLGATTSQSVKELVMEKTGIAFIPIRYQDIIDTLAKI